MECGRISVLHRPVLRRDVYGPRQIRGPTEKLLIEVVSPPTYRLAKGETRGGRVGEGERANGTVPAKEEQAQKAACNRPVDPKTSLISLEDLGEGGAGVAMVLGHDVV